MKTNEFWPRFNNIAVYCSAYAFKVFPVARAHTNTYKYNIIVVINPLSRGRDGRRIILDTRGARQLL